MALTFGQRGTKNKEVFLYLSKRETIVTEHFQRKKKKKTTENNIEDDAKKNTKKQISPLATVAYQYPVQSRRFFFSLPADFLFPVETRQYYADMIRFGPNRRESVRFGTNWRASEPNRRESVPI